MRHRLLFAVAHSVTILFLLVVASFPAQASITLNGVTCTNYHDFSNNDEKTYPNDGWTDLTSHYFVCFSANQGAAHDIYVSVSSLPNDILNLLANQNVVFYYFATRDDDIAFLGWLRLADPNSRCGNTAYVNFPKLIASQIYDLCTLNTLGIKIVNPSLYDVTSHETGHAFDLALWKQNNAQARPSQSVGFRTIVDGVNLGDMDRSDLYQVDLGAEGYAAPTRCEVFCCQVSVNYLEQDLGIPSVSTEPVCINGQVQRPYAALTNSDIMRKQDPYFFPYFPRLHNGHKLEEGDSKYYAELWAEEFAFQHGVVSPSAVPFLDSYISWLHCSTLVMRSYYTSLAPPTPYDLGKENCPAVSASDFTHH